MHTRSTWKARFMRLVVALVLATIALVVADRFDPFPVGLRAEYFPNRNWEPPAALTAIDKGPSTLQLLEAWRASPPDVFSVAWSGSIVAPRAGAYTFATRSDDGSLVFVDGTLVVDNGGDHTARLISGSIHLAPGTHELLIRYFQGGGPFDLDFMWARDGSALESVPRWALRSRRRAISLARVAPSLALTLARTLVDWLWVAAVVLGIAGMGSAVFSRLRALLERECAWPWLKWVMAGSLVLSLTGIWWGLPGMWVPIELTPKLILSGLAEHFSNGWYDAYPPLHFYVLSVAMSPILFLQSSGLALISGGGGYPAAVVICRLVSVAAAMGIVIATCVCGTRAFGKRAGVLAAAIVALTAPFVYYAKTANVDVPYLFWWSLSMVFYLRIVDGSRLRDYVIFAACATAAVCTKDQAYGLFVFAPVVLVVETWRANRRAGRPHPFARALFDTRLVAGAVTAAVLFALVHNIWFNRTGFMNHMAFIVGPGSESYRVFPRTLAGHWSLAALTGRLIQESLGWPLFLVCAVGVLVAAVTPGVRRMAIVLAVPAVAYYVSFINVILYNYDRFVLPICIVLALFGGLALDRLLAGGPGGRAWRSVAVGMVFAYSLLYAGTVDALMVADSRYTVQRWMKAQVASDAVIAAPGIDEILPSFEGFRRTEIRSIEEVQRDRPEYFLMNADYSRSISMDTDHGQLIYALQHGTIGYSLALRVRQSSPWPWLPGAHPDLVGLREDPQVFSILQFVNPTIEVFQRDGSGPGGSAVR